MDYLTVKEAGEIWLVPTSAKKPADGRYKINQKPDAAGGNEDE